VSITATDDRAAEAAARRERALLALVNALKATDYRFTTISPASHARVSARPENAWARNLTGVFGWSRPFAAELLPPALFEALHGAGLIERCGAGWRSRVRVSSLDGWLFVHSAYPTEGADAVFFGPDTYRFAAAIQGHLATDHQPIRRAADIGCGAGPGAILIAAARPEAQVLALDINDRALELTRLNAESAATPNVEARHSDLLAAAPGEFDLIVANPPYLVDPAERAYRHGGGPLGAALSLAILEAALPRLSSGGSLLLYTGVAIVEGEDPFRQRVAAQLAGSSYRWDYREIDPDVFGEELLNAPYTGADRIAAIVFKATRPPCA
jgi:methylase of polypeptide subunit release factors